MTDFSGKLHKMLMMQQPRATGNPRVRFSAYGLSSGAPEWENTIPQNATPDSKGTPNQADALLLGDLLQPNPSDLEYEQRQERFHQASRAAMLGTVLPNQPIFRSPATKLELMRERSLRCLEVVETQARRAEAQQTMVERMQKQISDLEEERRQWISHFSHKRDSTRKFAVIRADRRLVVKDIALKRRGFLAIKHAAMQSRGQNLGVTRGGHLVLRLQMAQFTKWVFFRWRFLVQTRRSLIRRCQFLRRRRNVRASFFLWRQRINFGKRSVYLSQRIDARCLRQAFARMHSHGHARRVRIIAVERRRRYKASRRFFFFWCRYSRRKENFQIVEATIEDRACLGILHRALLGWSKNSRVSADFDLVQIESIKRIHQNRRSSRHFYSWKKCLEDSSRKHRTILTRFLQMQHRRFAVFSLHRWHCNAWKSQQVLQKIVKNRSKLAKSVYCSWKTWLWQRRRLRYLSSIVSHIIPPKFSLHIIFRKLVRRVISQKGAKKMLAKFNGGLASAVLKVWLKQAKLNRPRSRSPRARSSSMSPISPRNRFSPSPNRFSPSPNRRMTAGTPTRIASSPASTPKSILKSPAKSNAVLTPRRSSAESPFRKRLLGQKRVVAWKAPISKHKDANSSDEDDPLRRIKSHRAKPFSSSPSKVARSIGLLYSASKSKSPLRATKTISQSVERAWQSGATKR